MKNSDTCENCGDLLVHPRGDTPYCEDCGWPDEDRLEYPKTILIRHPEHDSIFALAAQVEGETMHWAWYAIDDELGTLIGAGSDDEQADAVRNAINTVENYERKEKQ